MLHEGLVWKISTGGASPLRGAGPWRSYLYAKVASFDLSWHKYLSFIGFLIAKYLSFIRFLIAKHTPNFSLNT